MENDYKKKAHVIITACDKKYGDFLIEHWLESLEDSGNLKWLDVVVLDYGLSRAQKFYLQSRGVRVYPCTRDGHVVIIRFRDMARFLGEHPYDQVILSDSGDIVIQGSLKPILEQSPQRFRAVMEELKTGFSLFLTDEFFKKEDKKMIRRTLVGKDMINAGFFAGPGEKMKQLGEMVDRMILDKSKFGPDQLVVNYLLHREGFVSLDRTYNYVIATSSSKVEIKDGLFYSRGDLISVVHNTGNWKFLRPVENFGYRNSSMKLKQELMFLLKRVHGTSDSLYDIRDHLKLRLRELRSDMKDYYHRSTVDVDQLFSDFVDQIGKIEEPVNDE